MPVGFEGSGDSGEDGRGVIPPKGSGGRPGPPPPGGGPPPPGTFGGFGMRPQIFRGLPSLNDGQLPILMRKRGLSPAPGVMPGAPGKSDTVPAMLTPGEVVMNRGVTSNPELMQFLLSLNQQGAQQPLGMSEGGVVPEMGGGEDMDADEAMSSGVHPESPALQFIRLLLALDSGGVEGHAFGGVAGMGKFGGWLGKKNPALALPPTGDGISRDAGGNVNRYNPASPWGTLTGSTNPTTYGQGQRLLGAAGQAGYFDPRGNQQLINSQIEAAQGTKDALVRRQMNAADLSGLDPAQAAVARLQALRETGRGVQDISAQIRGDAARSQDDFYKGLFDKYAGADIGYILGEQGARNDRIRDQNQGRIANKNSGGYWGRLAGNIAGQAAGSFSPFGGGGMTVDRRSTTEGR